MPEKPPAYEAYQTLADAYANNIDSKPHNAFYDRPAMLSLLPEVTGKRILDAGCGPGAYAQELAERGATVVACDISERMLQHAQNRLRKGNVADAVELQLIDLTQPLSMFQASEFDIVNAPLCLDYIADWHALFQEFWRVMKPGGTFVFSCGHPAFDAEYFKTKQYFSVEAVSCVWSGFGIRIRMPSYRRSLEEIFAPLVESKFIVTKVHEPRPTADFKAADRQRYEKLMQRPGFLCVRATKPLQERNTAKISPGAAGSQN